MDFNNGDTFYCFKGEEIISFQVVTPTLVESVFDEYVTGKVDKVHYYFFKKHCYKSKADAIAGMLDALLTLTECDCGEDEDMISFIRGRIPNCS